MSSHWVPPFFHLLLILSVRGKKGFENREKVKIINAEASTLFTPITMIVSRKHSHPLLTVFFFFILTKYKEDRKIDNWRSNGCEGRPRRILTRKSIKESRMLSRLGKDFWQFHGVPIVTSDHIIITSNSITCSWKKGMARADFLYRRHFLMFGLILFTVNKPLQHWTGCAVTAKGLTRAFEEQIYMDYWISRMYCGWFDIILYLSGLSKLLLDLLRIQHKDKIISLI